MGEGMKNRTKPKKLCMADSKTVKRFVLTWEQWCPHCCSIMVTSMLS